jgi:hypothetical protein
VFNIITIEEVERLMEGVVSGIIQR